MSKTILTNDNLLKAYFDCRKNKRKTINALKFEMNLENNLHALLQKLQNRTYVPGRSICFVVIKPKPREIFAAEFCDRVIHHLLINQVQKIWENKIFIDDSYACRPNKGNHYGVERLQQYAKSFTYYGAFDIANFFGSIDKNVTYKSFEKVILTINRPDWWRDEILWIAKTIIFHNPANNYYYKGDPKLQDLVPPHKSLIHKNGMIGLPIGNLTSQFLANVYLNELDQFVTKTLGVKGYGRYVDDFVIFANSKEELRNWRDQICEFLKNELHLHLHPKKQQIQPTSHGIPFVGYFIKPWGVTVRRNVVKTLKNKIYGWNNSGDVESMIPSINSYFGHLCKAKSSRLRHHLICKHLSLEMKTRIVVVGNWRYLKVRKEMVKTKQNEIA
ncbi:MAG: Retron-type reverse transcriptase [Microgenomates group bacterium GW2011_GWF2_45_18]|nr:MAG: Retron-type reverse transcriptase [Microgenomates group bacterium GW2011_GWF2_45_18]